MKLKSQVSFGDRIRVILRDVDGHHVIDFMDQAVTDRHDSQFVPFGAIEFGFIPNRTKNFHVLVSPCVRFLPTPGNDSPFAVLFSVEHPKEFLLGV